MGSDYGRKAVTPGQADPPEDVRQREEADRVREERFQRQQAVQLAISAGRSDPSEIINTARMIHEFIMGEQSE